MENRTGMMEFFSRIFIFRGERSLHARTHQLRRGREIFSPLLILLGVFFSGLFFEGSPPSYAESRDLKAGATEKIDAVLVLDTSGSMLVNDPKRLRDEGARLFLQFLKGGDQVAVIDFSEEARIVRPLSPFDPQQAQAVSTQVGELKSEGQFTDLLSGIDLARQLLDKEGRTDAKPIVILLSDGKMEPHPSRGTSTLFTERLLDEIIPEMKAKGQKVYTLAFSQDADKDLLQQIASGSDGRMWFTPDADKVHESYAELFLAVKKPQVIPLSSKGFSIDKDVQEATFYINRESAQDVRLTAPDGTVISSTSYPANVKWFSSTKFDVITITTPEVGTWNVSGISSEEGFATILTNLKLITDWPSTIPVGRGELLQARLYESEKPIALPNMTGVIRYAFQVTPTDRIAEPIIRDFLVDDGTKGDKVANDGVFSFLITIPEDGDYRLRIIADAPTFERQLQIPFRVRPPLVTLSVVQAMPEGEEGHDDEHEEHGDEHESAHKEHKEEPHGVKEEAEHGHAGDDGKETGNEHSVFQVSLSDELRGLRNVEIQLAAVDEKRNRFILPVKPYGHGGKVYIASASLLPHDGEYELRASLSAEGAKRVPVRESSASLQFTRESLTKEQEHSQIIVEMPKEEKKEEKKSGLPILELLVLSIINIGAGLAALFLLKKSQGKADGDQLALQVPGAVLEGIKDLESRMAVAEVDISSEEFNAAPAEPPPVSEAPAQG